MHKGLLKFSFWLLGLLLVGGLIAHWGLFVVPQQKIAKLDAKLRAEGRPMRLADFEPAPIPDAENAAPLYLEAYQLLESLELNGNDIFYYSRYYWDKNSDEEKRAAFLTLLADPVFEEAMAKLDEATARALCQFEVNYQGSAMDFLVPHVTPILGLTKLLNTYIKVQVDNLETAELTITLVRLSGLALRLEDEPFLISQLVRIANIALYKDALAYTLSGTESNPEFLQETEVQLAKFPDEPIHLSWMQFERLYNLEIWRSGRYFEMIGYGDFWSSSPDFYDAITYLCHCLVTSWDESYFLESFLEIEETFSLPYYEIDWAFEKKRLEEIPKPYFLSRGFINMRKSRGLIPKAKALIQLSKIAVGLYQIRLDTGAFPDDLSGIKNVSLLDPFTNTPLKYSKTDDGFRLYSVGPNQVDEQGVKDRKTDADDLLWSHPYVD